MRKGFLEDGQFEKIISYCPEVWFRAIVEVGRTYGWRIGELLSLRVRQVDLLAHVIRLEPRHHQEPRRKGSEHDANGHALLLSASQESSLTIMFSLGRTGSP